MAGIGVGPDDKGQALERVLAALGPLAVAVSGGVDSLTLSVAAHRQMGAACTMFHATSPAVTPEATARVREMAAREGWRLEVFDAGEFADPDYRRNPHDRCFFCKTSLYGAVRGRTTLPVVSGTNTDDLGEYRPGLRAAAAYGVAHPFVQAGLSKQEVRALARRLGLGAVAELPAAPCLSSRVETGIYIEGTDLRAVHAAETLVTEALDAGTSMAGEVATRNLLSESRADSMRDEGVSEAGGPGAATRTVRCRLRAAAVVVELDPGSLDGLGSAARDELAVAVSRLFAAGGRTLPVRFAPYRTGSAFLRPSEPAAS